MNSLFAAALEVQHKMQSMNWPFCFIGGLAVLRWGEARMTQDIDLCVLCGFGNEADYAAILVEEYRTRIDDAFEFAINNRVLLLHASNGVAVDISLSGLPFEDEMIRRATAFQFGPECALITCSAEDLIVLKAFADRSKDWNDIEGIVMRCGPSLDLSHIFGQLKPLCELKDSPEIIARLKKITAAD